MVKIPLRHHAFIRSKERILIKQLPVIRDPETDVHRPRSIQPEIHHDNSLVLEFSSITTFTLDQNLVNTAACRPSQALRPNMSFSGVVVCRTESREIVPSLNYGARSISGNETSRVLLTNTEFRWPPLHADVLRPHYIYSRLIGFFF